MTAILLTRDEIAWATGVGQARNANDMALGWMPKYGQNPKDTEMHHVLGAMGELATVKALGLTWPGSTTKPPKSAPDIPPDIQVRTSKYREAHLIIHDDDPAGHRYFLVVGGAPAFDIVGWIYGHAAKRPDWHWTPNGRPPCFWVPQRELCRTLKP